MLDSICQIVINIMDQQDIFHILANYNYIYLYKRLLNMQISSLLIIIIFTLLLSFGTNSFVFNHRYLQRSIQKKQFADNKQYDPPLYCSNSRAQSQVKIQAEQTQIKQRKKLVTTNYGFNMYVDSMDLTVSNSIEREGTWQPGYIILIGHLVKEGDYVLNLGSQSGLEALVLGKLVGSTGKIFVFQPYSFSNLLVKKNFQINNMSQYAKIYRTGASDEKKKAIISVVYWNTGASQVRDMPPNFSTYIFQEGDYPIDEIQQIMLDKVDNVLPPNIKLNFALIDVEKMEIKALRGMKQVIERSPDLIIMTQWQFAGNPYSDRREAVDFLNWMVEKKYRIYLYQAGDNKKCRIGRFRELTTQIEEILKLTFQDIFFFPGHITPPS